MASSQYESKKMIHFWALFRESYLTELWPLSQDGQEASSSNFTSIPITSFTPSPPSSNYNSPLCWCLLIWWSIIPQRIHKVWIRQSQCTTPTVDCHPPLQRTISETVKAVIWRLERDLMTSTLEGKSKLGVNVADDIIRSLNFIASNPSNIRPETSLEVFSHGLHNRNCNRSRGCT